MHKNARALETKAIGHPVQCWNWNNAQNKLSEEKRENPVGKPPLKLNTESSLDHPDEITPNNEQR